MHEISPETQIIAYTERLKGLPIFKPKNPYETTAYHNFLEIAASSYLREVANKPEAFDQASWDIAEGPYSRGFNKMVKTTFTTWTESEIKKRRGEKTNYQKPSEAQNYLFDHLYNNYPGSVNVLQGFIYAGRDGKVRYPYSPILEKISFLPKNSNILDIGCGTGRALFDLGNMLTQVRHKNPNLYGFAAQDRVFRGENNRPVHFDEANLNFELILGDFFFMDSLLPDNTFDLILSQKALEFSFLPGLHTLQILNKKLKMGGMAYVGSISHTSISMPKDDFTRFQEYISANNLQIEIDVDSGFYTDDKTKFKIRSFTKTHNDITLPVELKFQHIPSENSAPSFDFYYTFESL